MLEREKMVEELKKLGYIKSKEVEQAMLKVPRELFVIPELKHHAYTDSPLPIPGKATISAPHMHAIYLESLKLKQGEKVLEVGFGSGILLAYMKELVGEAGEVYGIEVSEETFKFGKENLRVSGYLDKVKIFLGDGYFGLKEYSPFDKIAVSAASPQISQAWLDQLKNGGILLLPLGSGFGFQKLIWVKKENGKIKKKELFDVAFVELVRK